MQDPITRLANHEANHVIATCVIVGSAQAPRCGQDLARTHDMHGLAFTTQNPESHSSMGIGQVL